MSEAVIGRVLRRDRAIVIGALATLTAVAWAYTVWLAERMSMGGMQGGGMPMAKTPGMGASMGMGAALAPGFKAWTGTEFIVTFVMWCVMMIGMMTPSAAPMILIYARVGRQAALQGKPLAATGFFAGGYLLAWAAFSLVATIGQWLLERAALLTPMTALADDVLGALVLIAAGLFQWTPAKDSCLRHCRAPLGFIQQHGGFRRDPLGSLGVGFRHGLFCVGCCWALMALLFVGGVMNIVWIAGLTIFVLVEKVAPPGRLVSRLISRVSGAGLVAWGASLLILG
jgi:predicted metal-binding membrane protein